MWLGKKYRIEEVSNLCGVEQQLLIEWIEEEWIRPCDEKQRIFDDEDLARINLIHHLMNEFGVNQDSVPIILHLVDQIHCMQQKLKS